MRGYFKQRRRDKLRAQPFLWEWESVLCENVPLYTRLPEEDRRELQGHIHVFLDEKHFEGCDGLDISDDIRLTIAAEACLLLLHRDTDYYPGLVSILVYPTTYVAPVAQYQDDGVVSEFEEDRSGETWDQGSLVLSWEDVMASGEDGYAAYNVVLHEFAHQLDLENGEMDGVPLMQSAEQTRAWVRAMEEGRRKLETLLDADKSPVLDEYAIEDFAEFFAVATESFFELPHALRAEYPEVYNQLVAYYRQDPALWQASAQ